MRNSGADRARDAPTRLARSIADDIREHGPMSFRDFMERALYEPGRGYYARLQTPWSEAADFVTAPQVDVAFGTAVASLARECDAALGAPRRFDLIEQGGGDGALIGDVCDALARDADELYRRTRVWCIERGAAARERQQERLARHVERVRWLDGLAEIRDGDLEGLLFSNELLDAFPVHRVVWRDGRLCELFVDLQGDELAERAMEPSTSELGDYLERNGIELEEGQAAEICLAVAPWIGAVAQRLRRGFVLTVDYGAETPALYGPGRPRGTLVCQHRYQLNDQPYARVGEQDITAHVDLGNLRRRGEELGLHCAGTCSLAVFLLGFGAGETIAAERGGGGDDPDAIRRRLGLRHLLFTEIGDAHRVMLQYKDVGPIAFGLDRLG